MNKIVLRFLLITTAILPLKAQEKFLDPIFGERIDLGLIEFDPINEASGIAASRKSVGVLWTHNDSGDTSRVFALNIRGEHLGIYYLNGVVARDWEDIALGPGPDSNNQYLYIGDIGDNNAVYDIKYIYRVIEPDADTNQIPIDTTIYGIDVITYKYPDGNRDAETIMVDSQTRDIYIISKLESNVNVYRASYPQSTTDTLILEHKATLGLTGITGGDISPSGREIILKNYTNIFYWYRAPGEEVWEALEREPIIVPYIMEPQGEAVCWEPKELGGYYTVSEEIFSIPAHLYFYPRLDSTLKVIENNEPALNYFLGQNYPNPFNPSAKISYSIPELSFVTLKIYDVLGNEIETLVNEEKPSGTYEITWYAEGLPSGIYFYRLESGKFVSVKKMILIK